MVLRDVRCVGRGLESVDGEEAFFGRDVKDIGGRGDVGKNKESIKCDRKGDDAVNYEATCMLCSVIPARNINRTYSQRQPLLPACPLRFLWARFNMNVNSILSAHLYTAACKRPENLNSYHSRKRFSNNPRCWQGPKKAHTVCQSNRNS